MPSSPKYTIQSVSVPKKPLERFPKASDRLEYKYAHDAYTDALTNVTNVLETFNEQRSKLGEKVMQYLLADANYQFNCDRADQIDRVLDVKRKHEGMRHMGLTAADNDSDASVGDDVDSDDFDDLKKPRDFSPASRSKKAKLGKEKKSAKEAKKLAADAAKKEEEERCDDYDDRSYMDIQSEADEDIIHDPSPYVESIMERDHFDPTEEIKRCLYNVRNLEVQLKHTYQRLEAAQEQVLLTRRKVNKLRPAQAFTTLTNLVFTPFLDPFIQRVIAKSDNLEETDLLVDAIAKTYLSE